MDKAPFALGQLPVGARVNVTMARSPGGDPDAAASPADGRPPARRAIEVVWRKPGGESKLEGVVEAVERGEGDAVTVIVHGWRVPVVAGGARVVRRDRHARDRSRKDVLAMVRAGEYVARSASSTTSPATPSGPQPGGRRTGGGQEARGSAGRLGRGPHWAPGRRRPGARRRDHRPPPGPRLPGMR